jgi:DNA-binding transcriptional regulator LsrR (DeoR family)
MTPERAAEIRRAYLAREAKQAELARAYGIAQSSVSRIVAGRVWVRP